MLKNPRHHILVVDDEPDIRELIREILEDEGYEVDTAENANTAMLARKRRRPDLVLLDIWLPDTDGISLLRQWSNDTSPLFPVIMMSGHGSVETAVEATRLGAYDYIEKPLTIANLLLTIQNALKTSQISQENRLLKQQFSSTPPMGSSPVMQVLKNKIEKIASHNAWTLINGEAGVGKEVFARYLHEHSARSKGALIEIRAASLLKENSTAEIFGSEENSKVHHGLLEQANGGTLLIDEISDMDIKTQARLYSALETKTFHRVGGIETVQFDAYIIATTNKDLSALVKENMFREDLYYQLNVMPLSIPPLREHPQDIPELFNYYTDYFSRRDGLSFRNISTSARSQLLHYQWPGNIRELKNLVQRLLILGTGDEISASEIASMLGGNPEIPSESHQENKFSVALNRPLRDAREDFERLYFNHHLIDRSKNITDLAEISGMERTHLYRKLKTLGVDIKSIKKRAIE